MAQSLHIGLEGPFTNLPFGICAIYFDLKVSYKFQALLIYFMSPIFYSGKNNKPSKAWAAAWWINMAMMDYGHIQGAPLRPH